jgi:hypothetical protein
LNSGSRHSAAKYTLSVTRKEATTTASERYA